MLINLIATWFGSGYLKPAPGTWGSAASLPFGAAILYLGGIDALLAAILCVFALGTYAAHEFMKRHGVHDDKRIVVDETAGQWIAMIPCSFVEPWSILLAFILFRIFDILKPWPISYIDQKLHGAYAVMMDDVLAGIAAGFILLGAVIYV